ncbi:MAG: UTP--glucose-1-phosphate uridylyltransferase GalU [Malacoplasma sp.]|nr:UTP--glucose-1-phosphate uridylyltransferase GalU [Malacoplasma sp.]
MELKKVKKVIIPAAGLGTRFLPATKAMPKEMLPILDKPAIQFIVEEIVNSGIKDILIIVSQSKNSIMDYFDYSFELEERLKHANKEKEYFQIRKIADMARIQYIRQKEPKGLGDAILCAKQYVGDEPFGIILGDDIVIPTNPNETPALKQCIDLFNQKQKSVIGVQKVSHNDVSKYGIVDLEHDINENHSFSKIKNMIEKPKINESPSDLAILGRYVLNHTIFNELESIEKDEKKELGITEALLNLSKKEGVYAKLFTGKRYDIGSRFGYLKATIDHSLSNPCIKKDLLNYLEEIVKKEKK